MKSSVESYIGGMKCGKCGSRNVTADFVYQSIDKCAIIVLVCQDCGNKVRWK